MSKLQADPSVAQQITIDQNSSLLNVGAIPDSPEGSETQSEVKQSVLKLNAMITLPPRGKTFVLLFPSLMIVSFCSSTSSSKIL